MLREFKESFPEHVITIEPDDTPGLVSSLLRQRIDLALALAVEKEPQLECHPLFADELHFILSPLHPWAQAGRIDRSELPRHWGILHWRGKRLNLAEETFIGLCEAACARLRS